MRYIFYIKKYLIILTKPPKGTFVFPFSYPLQSPQGERHALPTLQSLNDPCCGVRCLARPVNRAGETSAPQKPFLFGSHENQTPMPHALFSRQYQIPRGEAYEKIVSPEISTADMRGRDKIYATSVTKSAVTLASWCKRQKKLWQ